MGRSFTDAERAEIRNKLKTICRESWKIQGYRKTSVDSLCKEAGISKGAFYLFYDSKEQLFYEIIAEMQTDIYKAAVEEMEAFPGCGGVQKALKRIYRMYDATKFLQRSSTEDYKVLLGKLDDEKRTALISAEQRNAEVFISNQQLAQSGSLVLSVLYSLLMNVKNEAILPEDHRAVFDFMVDQMIPTMYK